MELRCAVHTLNYLNLTANGREVLSVYHKVYKMNSWKISPTVVGKICTKSLTEFWTFLLSDYPEHREQLGKTNNTNKITIAISIHTFM